MTVKKIAKKVRKIIEEEVRQKDIADDPETLGGVCGYASYGLHKMLPGSTYVYGRFTTSDGFKAGHAWVELGDLIIDITATQFGFEEKILITKKGGKRAKRYSKGIEGKEAVQNLKHWDYPKNWMRNFPRKLKRRIGKIQLD